MFYLDKNIKAFEMYYLEGCKKRVNYMKKTGKIRHKFINPFLMWFLVAIGVLISVLMVPNIILFERSYFGAIIFLVTICYWIYFFMKALIENRNAVLSVDAVNKLITKGVYGIVRHPIYSADIFLSWGFLLVFPTLKILVSIMWLTFILFIWMILEENALEEKFGKEYREYENSVPMIIPKIKISKK